MTRTLIYWLIAIVALCGVSLWLGQRPEPTPEPNPRSEPVATSAAYWSRSNARDPVHLVVLNGTGIGGLAREFSLELAVAGCVVERVANAPHDHFAHTLLVNRSLAAERAGSLADLLGGVPVLREWSADGTEDAVLVLGADYATVLAALRRHTERGG